MRQPTSPVIGNQLPATPDVDRAGWRAIRFGLRAAAIGVAYQYVEQAIVGPHARMNRNTIAATMVLSLSLLAAHAVATAFCAAYALLSASNATTAIRHSRGGESHSLPAVAAIAAITAVVATVHMIHTVTS